MRTSVLLQTLVRLGLSDAEANTYLAALPLGATSILKLSRVTQIKRTTLYAVVESLQKKGLMRIEERGFKRVVLAESPDNLDILLEEKRTQLQRVLPDLKLLHQEHGGSALIRYHEGLDSIKALYLGLLKEVPSQSDYLVIGNQESWFDQDPAFFRRFIEKRARCNFRIRCLFTESETARSHQRYQKNYAQEVRILPPSVSISTNLVIVPHQVVVHQLHPPVMAMVIENSSIVQMHREFFEVIWKSAE